MPPPELSKCAGLREFFAFNLFKDPFGIGARVFAVGDGSPDDDEIGAVAESVCGCGYAFLVAAC